MREPCSILLAHVGLLRSLSQVGFHLLEVRQALRSEVRDITGNDARFSQTERRDRDRVLASNALGRILERNSDAMNPEVRYPSDRPWLEGSKSRDRLSGALNTRVNVP